MKTYQDLGITEKEYVALQTVRDNLRKGAYKHVDVDVLEERDSKLRSKYDGAFNMNISCRQYNCGQAGCIGGWMGITMGMDPYDADSYVNSVEEEGSTLWPLFFPPVVFGWDDITPDQAANAIDKYLETGDARTAWTDVLWEDDDDA